MATGQTSATERTALLPAVIERRGCAMLAGPRGEALHLVRRQEGGESRVESLYDHVA